MFAVRVKKSALMSLTAVALFMAAPASANEFINNDVSGTVKGDIVQEASNPDAAREVAVGSIKAYRAMDNKAEGYVGGDIIQTAAGHAGPATPPPYHDDTNKIVQVGAIEAEMAFKNKVQGHVGGDIVQNGRLEMWRDPGRTTDVRVGAIDTNGGDERLLGFVAENNKAEGYVGGDIVQTGTGSAFSTRVGVIAPR